MKIKAIRIKNFQSHKNTEVNFHSDANVIVGGSDTGKTGILRALYWVLENRPSGDSIRSWWAGNELTEVEIELSSGSIIRRVKGKGKNSYFLGDQEFKAFGANVPEEVKKVFPVGSLNLQKQADNFFLIKNSPGEVAKVFNRVSNLEQIDSTMANIKSRDSENNRKLERAELDIQEASRKLEDFAFVGTLQERIKNTEDMEKELQEKTAKFLKMKKLVNLISMYKKQLEKFNSFPDMEQRMKNAKELEEELSEKDIKLVNIKKILQRKKKYDLVAKLSPKLEELERVFDRAKLFQIQTEKKEEQYKKISFFTSQIKKNLALLEKYKLLFTDIQVQIKEEEEDCITCPSCGEKIKIPEE